MATHIPTNTLAKMPVTMAMGRTTTAVGSDWKTALPVLEAKGITLRELRVSDAPSLLALLTTEEVTRFISPPPTTIEGFERFIQWAQREREAGRYGRERPRQWRATQDWRGAGGYLEKVIPSQWSVPGSITLGDSSGR